MKRCCIGLLAHVDAGKTTLSEALLYAAGARRRLGRVDHGDSFLDSEPLERERGITVFSKQAVLELGSSVITLLDTPGHADLCSEMERTLQVLDYAILVISGTDGVQAHTRTLWRLLVQYRVPVFLFVNKMDLDGADRAKLLAALQRTLDGSCIDFTAPDCKEAASLCDDGALEEYLADGTLCDETVARLIAQRKLFPCFFGSALKLDGIEELLQCIDRYTLMPDYADAFGARVFKISHDAQGGRLTHMKITGGELRAKAPLTIAGREQKVDQLRLYSGAKFRPVETAPAGSIIAVTGLEDTFPGQGLGTQEDGRSPVLQSALSYRLELPDGVQAHTILPKLRLLQEEDPQLCITWQESSQEIHVQVMGQVQLEVLQRLIAERFGLAVTFGSGSIVYRETIADAAEGVGHFEPLRHYAEVRLLLEPAERGSGVTVCSAVSSDLLDLNWQRLILTHVTERQHPGVLTGSPLTDVKITLIDGRVHLKHTEGGDLRQATYRAIRQGLMETRCTLLEPYYNLRLELPQECVGRAMSDIQNMGGSCESPQMQDDFCLLIGYAPVAALRSYSQQVSAYTRGRGRLSCSFRGYEPCREQDAVVAASGYDPEHDPDAPTGSIFCCHGAGEYVPWNRVKEFAHTQGLKNQMQESDCALQNLPPVHPPHASSAAEEKELQRIFEQTYGKVQRSAFEPKKPPARTSLDEKKYRIENSRSGPEYLLVDGYNIIFAWDRLKAIAAEDIAAAREALVDILANYRSWRKCEVILVFDAYKVKGNRGSLEKKNGITIVYTKEAQTADAYIEQATYTLGKQYRVRVATSDNMEQVIILGHGALRISAKFFEQEVSEVFAQIDDLLTHYALRSRSAGKLRDRATIIEKKG